MRLSGDGRYLATCVEEQFNTTQRAPFFVIAGINHQGQDGLWVVALPQATAVWHTVSFAVPGISGRHVYYSSQKPAVWLNPDGTQRGAIEQKAGLFNPASVPFWSGTGSAYMTDQEHTAILQIGEGDPVPVAQKAEMGVPKTWRFRLKETSSADSYRLASHDGGTLVVPVSDPRDSRKLDLFLMTRNMSQAAGSVAEAQSRSTEFNSRVDAFEIGSLLKPGDLPGKFMPEAL